MELRLSGGFWGPYIRQIYLEEIDSLREAFMTHILPSLPDPEQEGKAYEQAKWEGALSQSSDECGEDMCDLAEQALWEGVDRYMRLTCIHQATLNMGTVILWHLIEQQTLSFHRQQVLLKSEESDVMNDPKMHKKLIKFEVFEDRLEKGGYPLNQLDAWPRVNELRHVANTVKHGAGYSARKLHDLRPDLFSPPDLNDPNMAITRSPDWIDRPAAGDDLYVSESDLQSYFEAATSFWDQFCTMIEGDGE